MAAIKGRYVGTGNIKTHWVHVHVHVGRILNLEDYQCRITSALHGGHTFRG